MGNPTVVAPVLDGTLASHQLHELGAFELPFHDEADVGPKRPLRLAPHSGLDPKACDPGWLPLSL